MIKNKTLHFLAKALPFLKEDIDSIPKVVKLSKDRPSGHHGQNGYSSDYPQLPQSAADQSQYLPAKRKRSVMEPIKLSSDGTALNNGQNIGNDGGSGGNLKSSTTKSVDLLDGNWDSGNLTSALASLLQSSQLQSSQPSESRTKPCESKDGM